HLHRQLHAEPDDGGHLVVVQFRCRHGQQRHGLERPGNRPGYRLEQHHPPLRPGGFPRRDTPCDSGGARNRPRRAPRPPPRPPTPSIATVPLQDALPTCTYTDNSTQNLTTAVTWSSSNSAVATVSNATGSNGLGTALGIGSSSITASSGVVVSPAATLTVTPATLVSIAVTPPSPSIANGQKHQSAETVNNRGKCATHPTTAD